MATIIDSTGTPASESSALSIIDVTLDIRQNKMVSVLLKQYNKQSQQIKFTVTDNGEKIELKEIEHTVLFKMMTPDGRRISSYCAINESDHTAILTVAKNYCSYPGKGTAELEVMDALEESQVGTMNLDVIIENSVYPDEMINGSSTYQGLDEKINAVRETCNSAIAAKEETETIRDECDGIRNTCNDLKEETQQYKNEAMSYAKSDKEVITAFVAEVNNNLDLQNEHLESMESLLENTPYTTVESEGEFELPVHTINDNKISDDSTWSSKKIIDAIYPVGAIYMSVNSTNPSTLLGGTWVAWGAGRVPIGVDAGDTDFATVEKTGGEKAHELTIDELPRHTHANWSKRVNIDANASGNTDVTCHRTNINSSMSNNIEKTGNDNSHNNIQPYITCYMWKRTA